MASDGSERLAGVKVVLADLFTDLTPGLHTFSTRYRSLVSGRSVSFADRTLIVEPF